MFADSDVFVTAATLRAFAEVLASDPLAGAVGSLLAAVGTAMLAREQAQTSAALVKAEQYFRQARGAVDPAVVVDDRLAPFELVGVRELAFAVDHDQPVGDPAERLPVEIDARGFGEQAVRIVEPDVDEPGPPPDRASGARC